MDLKNNSLDSSKLDQIVFKAACLHAALKPPTGQFNKKLCHTTRKGLQQAVLSPSRVKNFSTEVDTFW